jgi:uracil-DNA glycosylase family 4
MENQVIAPRLVRGTGPLPCSFLIVGEKPGEEEFRRGIAFCGRTGELLDTYLYVAGLQRHQCRVTNLYPYWTGKGNPDPTPEQCELGGKLLLEEIAVCKPKYILALGRLSASWFSGRPMVMEECHGLPFVWRGIPVVPAFHPAAGFRDPWMAGCSARDIRIFVRAARDGGRRPVRVSSQVPRATYRRSRVLKVKRFPVAIDTESTPHGPWGLSFSSCQGKAAVVTIADLHSGSEVAGEVILHSALYDLPILNQMGVAVRKFTDTRIMAFLLQQEPQSLKALARRHLGIEMEEFNDVVRPHFNKHAVKFLRRARIQSLDLSDPEERLELVKGVWKIKKPQNAHRRLSNIMRDLDKGSEPDLKKRWEAIEPEMRVQIEKAVGRPFPEWSFALVPPEKQIQYSARDADVTRQLYDVLMPKVKAMGLERVLKLDVEATPMISHMQEVGMKLDIRYTRKLEKRLARECKQMLAGLRMMAGGGFSPSSPQQVAHFLFRSLGLPKVRLTRTGQASTDDKVLETLLFKFGSLRTPQALRAVQFIRLLQKYREKAKFLSTFVKPLPGYAAKDGRVHPNIRTTQVVSGRPSTFDPNLLAYPKRSEEAKHIRNCFVASEGNELLSIDFSQIELRRMAHDSGDRIMIRAYRKGLDLHAQTATLLFNIPLSDVDELKHRYPAKTINFAVMYGITARALYEQLLLAGVTKENGLPYSIDECGMLIRRWFAAYPAVRDFLEATWAETRRFGYVRSASGRIRYLPNIHIPRDGRCAMLRFEAERQAGNFKIQEGATTIVKEGIARLHQYLEAHKLYSKVKPLLWIHDELLMEVPKGTAEKYGVLFGKLLQPKDGTFRVPIRTEFSTGQRWGDLKKVKVKAKEKAA